MKTRVLLFVTALSLSTLITNLHAQGTAFTYQGRLNDGANPANGSYDLRFIIYDNSVGGSQQGPILTNAATAASNGLFTVTLDFGNQFPGANRWLEIAVRTNGNGSLFTLNPRQPLTPAPYAITAGNVVSGGIPAGTYSNAVTFKNAANSFSGSFTGNGAGVSNVDALTLGGFVAANFWKLGGNAGANPTIGNFFGTLDNQPLEIRVNGLRVLRAEFGAAPDGAPNVIWGAPNNFVTPGIAGATIGGGGATNFGGLAYTNFVASNFATVGGGAGNQIGSDNEFNTVAGGFQNTMGTNSSNSTIGGGTLNQIGPIAGNSTIGGGYVNSIGTSSSHCTIAGGTANTISSFCPVSTIGGGTANLIAANAFAATIPGGEDNFAADHAFAAGRHAKAQHAGAFVWADSQNAAFSSTSSDQFLIRAAGGMGINTTNPASPLTVRSASSTFGLEHTDGNVRLATFVGGSAGGGWLGTVSNHRLSFFVNNGSASMTVDVNGRVGIGTLSPVSALEVVGTVTAGAFAPSSDRNLKENFVPVSSRDVLDKVIALPITRWNFKQDPRVEHIGPMAQDFSAMFEVGSDDRHIATVDADGVALAAIQGLNQKVEEQHAENVELKQRLDALEKIIRNQKSN